MIGLTKKKHGWIGVDVGTSHVKIAQLVRHHQQWQLAAAAIVPRALAWNPSELDETKAISSADEFATAASLRPDLRGHLAAATLPMSLCQVQHIDEVGKSTNREAKLREILSTLTCKPAGHLQCATWPAEANHKGTGPIKTNLIAAPEAWTDRLSRDIASTGWSCQTVDGLPFTLARAVSMVLPKDNTNTWAALDWGYSQATFCVVHEQRPVYVRCLKECGLSNLLNAIAEELGVNQSEALQLLQEQGLTGGSNDELSTLIHDASAKPLEKLELEINRTFSHLKTQRRQIIPEGVYLFGGGSTLHGIAKLLADRFAMEHRIWQFDSAHPEQNLPSAQLTNMLGPAIALSALAWEKL